MLLAGCSIRFRGSGEPAARPRLIGVVGGVTGWPHACLLSVAEPVASRGGLGS